MMQNKENLYVTARAAKNITLLSILSPVAGMIVEISLAWQFGASGAVDAFRIASLVLVFVNQLFMGSLLSNMVIPLFLEYRTAGREEDGWRLTFSLAGILGFISILFAIWAWFNPNALLALIGPGLVGSNRSDASFLIRFFSLTFVWMAWSGVISCILQVYRIFWLPPASQLFTNLCVVISIASVGREWGVRSIAIGTLIGSLTMFGLHLYFLRRIVKESQIQLSACLKMGPRTGILKALHLALPSVGLIFVSQWWNVAVLRVLSELPAGTLAAYGYALKLLIIGAFFTSITTVIFPRISEAWVDRNLVEMRRIVAKTVGMLSFLSLSAMILLYFINSALVRLIFMHGTMTQEMTGKVSHIFAILVFLIPVGCLTDVLYKIAYSVKDVLIPSFIQLISAICIVTFVQRLGNHFGVSGVAWAVVIPHWLVVFIMLLYLYKRHNVIEINYVIKNFYRLLLALFFPTVVSLIVVLLTDNNDGVSILSSVTKLALHLVIFIPIYFLAIRLFRVPEANEFINYVKWQVSQLILSMKSRESS